MAPIGEQQEFETRTMPHIRGLFQTALHLAGNRGSAAEAVHKVYAAARASFDRQPDGFDWRLELYRLLINEHRRNRHRIASRWSPQARAAAPSSEPSEGIAQALSRIPAPLREILLLVDCQAFSYKDAARILAISAERVAEGLVQGRNRMTLEFADAGLANETETVTVTEAPLTQKRHRIRNEP